MKSENASFSLATSVQPHSNQLGNDVWSVQCPNTGDMYNVRFDWDCSQAKRIYGQMLFLKGSIGRGYADENNRILVSSISSARQETAYIREICEYWEQEYPDRPLHTLNRAELANLLRKFAVKKSSLLNGSDELLGFSTIQIMSRLIDRTNNLYINGTLPDGFSYHITESFRKSAVAELLASHGLTYAEWKEGGTYGSIPMVCASLTVAEAIILIESDEAIIASKFFECWREFKEAPKLWFGENDRLALYRHIQTSQANHKSSRIIKWEASARSLGSSIDASTTKVFKKMPWNALGQLSDFCITLLKAALSIITILSGFRISETRSISTDGYEKHNDGSWWFKSENTKTENGFQSPRSLHGLVAQAANLITNLSALDPSDTDLPLFHCGFRSGAFNVALGWGKQTKEEWLSDSSFSLQTLRNWFRDFYKDFVLEKHPEAAQIHSHVSPHQARHTFAEFALRRFDGRIKEKIREHFRHQYGSAHTKRYTQYKLSESVREAQEQEYLREMIGRISENRLVEKLYGPAARRIEIELANVVAVTDEEFNEMLDTMAGNYSRFVAFEWGFCALPKGEEHLAKCHDRKTGTPNVDHHSCLEVCLGCPHSMNNEIQKETLIRAGISHNAIAKNHSLKAIADLSTSAVKLIERRILGK